MDRIAFDSPAYLVLLAGLPFLWWTSREALAALGRIRGSLAVALRTLVFVLVVLALAEAQRVHSSDRLTVLYVVDQSLSIAADAGQAMLNYVNEAIAGRGAGARDDLAGVIVFGRDAAVEIPPIAGSPKVTRLETTVARDQTDLAGAMKLAQAVFPHDTAKRVVLVTDGNQTRGNALVQARSLAESNIGIDVVPVRSAAVDEVAVEKITIPAEVQRGQPFELRAVLNRTLAEGRLWPIVGKLQIVRKTASGSRTLVDQDVSLEAGKRVFSIREEIDTPDFFSYQARFIPSAPENDSRPQNNEATAFTHVRGSGQVLLIEDHERKGQYDILVERLRSMNLEVTLRSTEPDQLFADLAQLQPFDTVILADVPRDRLSDQQMEMLERNTRNLAAGLVMLGGPNSFGAGGWTETAVERAMPVDFQVKNLKVMPTGALVLVIDRSGSMQGEKIQMSKAAAIAAIEVLGPTDQIGVVAFDTQAYTLVPLARVGNGKQQAARVSTLGADGGTNLMPGMEAGYSALLAADAAMKHLVVVSDGRTEDGRFQKLARDMQARGITTTCVAIGEDADSPLMQAIAETGGGKFYRVDRPRAIPRIFMKEARRVARPLVFERAEGFVPRLRDAHEMTQGIDGPLPPITGYVLTTPKQSPLVEIPIVSPEPSDNQVNPIVAGWTYGLGKAVAITTDGSRRWANAWSDWPQYGQLLSQIVRWSMRPQGDGGKFAVSTEARDGKVNVVVTAHDRDDEFLNFLAIEATAIAPDLTPINVDIKQAAPGRYVGEFDASEAGSYLIVIQPGPDRAAIRTGVTVAYSDEFAGRDTNEPLLAAIAATTVPGQPTGQVIEAPQGLTSQEQVARLLETDTFRHDLRPADSRRPVWPLMLLAAGLLFLADVFTRRVALGRDFVAPLLAIARNWLSGQTRPAEVELAIERLRGRKAEVADRWALKLSPRQLDAFDRDTATASAVLESAEPHTPATSSGGASASPDSPADGGEHAYLQRLKLAKSEAQMKSRVSSRSERPNVD